MPEGISQRKGNRRMEKAIKSISSKAETDNIVAWFIWKRNFPKPLRPLMRLFLDSVSLIPNSNHLFMQLNEVFYLFLVVNNCLYHIGRLFMAYGILLKAKSFSIAAKKGIKRLSEVLPRGNQLYPIFLFTLNPVLDRNLITLP